MKKKVLLIFGIILIAFVLEQIISANAFFEKLELKTYDMRVKFSAENDLFSIFSKKNKHTDKKIVIVSIDDYSIQKIQENPQLGYGKWPWPRDVWSGVLNFIEKGEPKAVLFDMVLSGQDDNPWHDRKLAKTVARYDNVVLGTSLGAPKKKGSNVALNEKIEHNDYWPTSTPLNVSVENNGVDNAITFYSNAAVHNIYTRNATMGVTNKVIDKDSVVRRTQPLFKLIKEDKAYYMPSLAFAGFLKYMGEDGQITLNKNKITYKGQIIPIDKNGQTLIGWHGRSNEYSYIPVSKILLSENNDKYANPEFFKDKIVIIGRTEPEKNFNFKTINPTYSYPEAVATALDNFINDTSPQKRSSRKIISKLPKRTECGLIVMACLILAILGFISKTVLTGVVNSLAFIIFYILLCFWLFADPSVRIWVPIVVPLYYLSITFGAVFAFRIHKALSKRTKIINMFGKFVSPKVLTELLKKRDNLVLKSTRKNITVMFCDVKNFTELSGKCDPEKLMDNLNELFNEIINIVLKNNGTVDKFIGDCVMAYWGDPMSSEDDAFMAVKTALEIKKKVNERKILNAQEDKIILDVKIGVNTGEALLGLAGSKKILSYTAMGDAVNVASRLDSACSILNRDILISKSTYEKAKDKIVVLEAGKIDIKGKENKIEIFEPIGVVEDIVVENEVNTENE